MTVPAQTYKILGDVRGQLSEGVTSHAGGALYHYRTASSSGMLKSSMTMSRPA